MLIGEIVSKVDAERHVPGRFPSRIIFARDFQGYRRLVDELRSVCDVTLDIAEYTTGDILPKFGELNVQLRKFVDKQILILSIGEYLRMCIKRETNKKTSEIPGIWEAIQAEHATTKYIIPIFGGRELFDQVVPIVDERQKDFIWELSESNNETEYAITICAPACAKVLQVDAVDFHDWLEKWTVLFSDEKRNRFSLATKLYKYSETTVGRVSVEVIDDPFAYVAFHVTDGHWLKREFGDEKFWSEVAKDLRRDLPFSATIKYMLNMGHKFDPITIFARLKSVSATDCCLLAIWYKMYPSDDYYTFALRNAKSIEDMPFLLRDAIFQLSTISERFTAERRRILSVMDLPSDENYFLRLDRIAAPEMRLALLTYGTIEERAYAIKTVSGLLRSGTEASTVADMVKSWYPDLFDYLSQRCENKIELYFSWYNASKLMNRPTTDVPCTIDFDSIDSRNKVLQQGGEGHVFWVDGLGAEWKALLISKLRQGSIPVSIVGTVAKAKLPTDTAFNRQWSNMDDKWDRLDKISHNGMPDDRDYFICVARQIDIVGEVASHIFRLLEKHNRVTITGDHGSSRLAALMFHAVDNFAIVPPHRAIVRSFGRYCELTEPLELPLAVSMEYVEVDAKSYVVMKTYEHFKKSGNAAGGNTDDTAVAGEVHGGMTPEEYLVPVIVVSRKTPLPTIPAPVKPSIATINKMGI